MSRYDGLIIPRSYSEYINKTDAATLLQALQLSGVMDNAPTVNSNHPVKSSGLVNTVPVNEVTNNNMHSVTSNAVALEAMLKADFANPAYLGIGTAVGQVSLNNSMESYKLLMVGVNYSNGEDNRTAIQLLPTIILVNRNTLKNSLAATLYLSEDAHIGILFHYVDNRHIYIDQIKYSSTWATGGTLQLWGIK